MQDFALVTHWQVIGRSHAGMILSKELPERSFVFILRFATAIAISGT